MIGGRWDWIYGRVHSKYDSILTNVNVIKKILLKSGGVSIIKQ